MILQQINTATMYRHGRCVWELHAAFDNKFQAAMLSFGIAAVGLQNEGYWSQPVSVSVGDFRAELQLKFQPGAGLGFTRPHYRARFEPGSHGVEMLRSFDLALKAGTHKRTLHILCSKFVE